MQNLPAHYFPNNPPQELPSNRWHSHARLLFLNCPNYYEYKEAPYKWK
ncbi:homoserine O-succinyltransferase [Halobacillus sp. BBL2006]